MHLDLGSRRRYSLWNRGKLRAVVAVMCRFLLYIGMLCAPVPLLRCPGLVDPNASLPAMCACPEEAPWHVRFVLTVWRWPFAHALQVYAFWIAATTVATNWVVLVLSASLGDAVNCDPLVANGTAAVEELAVACSLDNVFALLGATTAAVVLSVAVFLGSIERGHVGSFFRPTSYQQQTALDFLNYTKDEQVEFITARDPVYWTSVEAVRVFIASNWAVWDADPPAWFADPRWRAALPEEYLPDKDAQQAARLEQTA